ncbi:MAG TPA: ATP-binding cassette domain-containing protein, partial [Ktedonobacterales bacterium]|nr:ATP-binding cassette domain-containing protein [Ktedonobacterales bacterium]
MHNVRLVNSGDTIPDSQRGGPSTVSRSSRSLLRVQNLVKQYKVGDGTVMALRSVNLTVRPGEFVAIRGRSGAGKTTLLNLIAGLDEPTSGQVLLLDRDLGT